MHTGRDTGNEPWDKTAIRRYVTLPLMLLLVIGCAPKQAVLPPITPDVTNTYRLGTFVWHDLVTPDIERARKFYGALFGWEFPASDAPPDYRLATLHGRAVAGLVHKKPEKTGDDGSAWIPSISVADVDEAAASVGKLGGTILSTPDDIKARGRLALVRDPHGAEFVLLRARWGDPVESSPEPGAWIWAELWTQDPEASRKFYQSLLGYETRPMRERDGGEYFLFEKNGVPTAGVVSLRWKNIDSGWLPYLRVNNVKQTARRATELGGRSVLGPHESVEGGTLAILVDPFGAAFAVQQPTGDR